MTEKRNDDDTMNIYHELCTDDFYFAVVTYIFLMYAVYAVGLVLLVAWAIWAWYKRSR